MLEAPDEILPSNRLSPLVRIGFISIHLENKVSIIATRPANDLNPLDLVPECTEHLFANKLEGADPAAIGERDETAIVRQFPTGFLVRDRAIVLASAKQKPSSPLEGSEVEARKAGAPYAL